jgi:NitT/TauT family transport system substrate-binding protein
MNRALRSPSLNLLQRVIGLVGFLSFVGLCAAGAPARAQEKVTWNMGWLPQGSSIGFMMAAEKGYYHSAGLEVRIVRGYGGNRTANEVDQGQFEFGYVDPISLVLNRSNGGKIRLVGAINTQWPAAICWISNRIQPKTLDDLKGRSLGGGSASPVHNVVPAWLEMNGKPRDFIRLLRLDPAVIGPSLVDGRIDLVECWKGSDRAVMQSQAAAAGLSVGWFDYSAFGLSAYGSGIATSESILVNRGDMVRRFLSATYRGFADAISSPVAAAAVLVKMFPTVDARIALQQIKEIGELLTDPSTSTKGLGYMQNERMASTVAFVDRAYALGGKVSAADVFTNAYLGAP